MTASFILVSPLVQEPFVNFSKNLVQIVILKTRSEFSDAGF